MTDVRERTAHAFDVLRLAGALAAQELRGFDVRVSVELLSSRIQSFKLSVVA